ncbi:phage tail fiber protein [Tsuneonella sp. HG222]
MSATNVTEVAELKDIFQDVQDTARTAINAATEFFVSLHTADPGESGSQTTSETSYTGYTRQTVARSDAGWTISGSEVTNAATLEFGICTALGSPQTLTHFGIGLDETGAGTLLFKGALNDSIPMQVNFAPLIPVGELSVTAD